MREGLLRLKTRIVSLFRSILAGIRLVVRLWRANRTFLTPVLQRARILEPPDQNVLTRLYQVYWYAVFVVVLVFPSYPAEPFFIFPSLLALAIAWLVAMPQLGQTFLTLDMSALRAPQGTFRYFVAALRGAGIKVPPEADNPELEQRVDAIWHELGPEYVRATLLHVAKWLGYRFTGLGVIGIVGLLIGPLLASLHVGLLRGWSPVSVLYAIAVPTALFLVVALLAPVLALAFLSGIQAHIATEEFTRSAEKLAGPQPEPPKD